MTLMRKSDKKERALLVGVIYRNNTKDIVFEHLEELSLLADTAGAETIETITQKIQRINPAFYIGKGKAEQIVRQAKELKIDVIIFDDDLSPTQIKNYQKICEEIKVLDRSALILDIFRNHAVTKESQTQVELAHLQYLLPRLTRLWTHLERQMGGIGTRAGAGETQIEVDRRLIRTRIAKLKKELTKIEKEREVQAKRRKSEFKVALVGYTNAGKSTLLKALSGSDVYIADQLFATLDTTIRSVEIDSSHSFLMSDTIGFIRKLPHHLVASFQSTLRETIKADLLILVLDGSSPSVFEHYQVINKLLKDIDADRIPVLIAFNKVDKIDNEYQIELLRNKFQHSLFISAQNCLGFEGLINKIKEIMEECFTTANLFIPYNEGKKISAVQNGVEVLNKTPDEKGVYFTIKGSRNRIEHLQKMVDTSID
ncbi:MAG: GTPase HflX [Candidatus Marinimicrobia bacterium]|nr:GTPase HflX [Candidatus Neomarinimicrobiota bacterium]|tara:strand:+ start:32393 stop:33673 length:1281 start_codon:yes stop_codon:yes gene_type:complete